MREIRERVSTFQERLSEMLKENNMSNSELANRLGINRSAITHYLSGSYNPKFPTIKAMAQILGCTELYLVGYDVPKTPVKWNPDTQEIVVETTHPLTDDEMNLIVEVSKKPDSKARLLAYAKKLKELNDMEGGD